ncbi:MAG: hypothetical protein V3T65_07000, partial [Acidobacteriota bacterium]
MLLWQTHLSALNALPRLRIANGSLLCRAVIFGLTTLFFLTVPSLSRAQGVISTVAGTTWSFSGDGGPATDAPLGFLSGVTVDAAGNVFATDQENHLVVKISPGGVLTVVAGNGFAGYSGDGGQATSASLFSPLDVTVDSAGNLFIADRDNHLVRKVGTDGIITTVAGVGLPDFFGDDGPAIFAALDGPTSVAVDAAGNIFIADRNNNLVRKVSTDGIITTVVGNGDFSFAGDGGLATDAALDPQGVAVDAAGNLYVADNVNARIRKIDTSSGIITTVAGTGEKGFSDDDGPATSAMLNIPNDVAVDGAGNLFIADLLNDRIRK